jgi:hypothetical protein
MSRLIVDLKRCIRDKDPIEFLQNEYFLKALHPTQAQWVRRNKGNGSLVDAAEDYIPIAVYKVVFCPVKIQLVC